MIPLEDNYNDIIAKAQRGLKLSDSDVAKRAGVAQADVTAARSGEFDERVARKLAAVLQLGADALVAIGRKVWYPAERKVSNLAKFNTPYGDIMVNSYVVWNSNVAAAFDTGADCSGMLELPVKIQQVFLTHIHGDHVMELDRLKEKTHARAFVSEREPIEGAETFPEGAEFRIGDLNVQTRRTSGHARGGVTYLVAGLAFVGDAMFAGSMGGGLVSYDEALRTNRENILSLPDEMIICPGHGPLTTVGEEKIHNPFFAT